MSFTSGFFLIGILPWFVILYKLFSSKKMIRVLLLFAANCFFLFWGGVGSFLFLSAYAVGIWGLSAILFKARKKWLLAFSVVISAAPLVFFKYSKFLIELINSAAGWQIAAPSVIVPLGISFVTFEAVSLLADVYKGKTETCPNILHVFLYLTFFPTVTSGPIIRFTEFETGLKPQAVSCDTSAAIERIVIGLSKKVLIADKLAMIADEYFNGIGAGGSYSAVGLWIGSVAYTLQLYYDFSGYSDMAVGIGKLLGFDLRENFNKPYQAKSISDFWKRWHISLTQWFRDYIYIPLGGNRCSAARHILNMLVVWLVTGIWHGADWTFILWGLAYFVLLVFEKYVPMKKGRGTDIIGHIYTLFFVNLLWVLFRADNLSSAIRYLAGMFGGGSGALEARAAGFLPLIALAVLLCFPWNRLLSKFSGKKWYGFIRGAVLIALFVLAVSAIVHATYSPYIYGNF